MEPATIPLQGILPARVLSRVGTSVHETSQPGRALVMLANFSYETLTLPKSTAVAEEVSEELVDKINKPEQTSLDSSATARRKRKNEALYNKLLGGKLDHLPPEERQKIEPVLQKYAHVFHDEETSDFRSTNVIEHHILLEDKNPSDDPNTTPFAHKDEMKAQVENMLAKGVIRESSSPWSAPAILVPKRSPDGKPKYRFCVDFRALNAITKFDRYPLPRFEQSTSVLHGSKYFSVLDCYSEFWQVPIKEQHRERQDLPYRLGTTNLTDYHLAFQIVHQIFRDLWMLSFGTSLASDAMYSLMTQYSQNPQKSMLRGWRMYWRVLTKQTCSYIRENVRLRNPK